jgi:sulfhydrogenase subunit beta (sulfur reductase)
MSPRQEAKISPNGDGRVSGETGPWSVTDADIRTWLGSLLSSGWEVIAPVSARGPKRYERLKSAAEADLDLGAGVRARWSPKEFLLPRRETLLSYSAGNGTIDIEPTPLDTQPRVLFGMTPCDAAGLERLLAVFAGGPGDPYFKARRDATAIVTFTCQAAAPECFCTAVGGSPGSDEGSDVQVLLVEKGSYLVRVLTEKGRRLVEKASAGWQPPPRLAELETRIREQIAQVEATIGRPAIPAQAADLLERHFSAAAWDDEAGPCLGCRVCTMVCPSCSCFDVYDEGSSACGERCRCWDGCTQQLFTAHATGHNPRSTQTARFRQRVMHKFSYFPGDHGGVSMCVGCGRCAALCPAGLDVHQTVMRIMQRTQAPEGASHGA